MSETENTSAAPVEMVTIQVAKCSISGCNRPAVTDGLCASHYRRKKLYGDPLKGARAFTGLETTVIGISVPKALVDAIKAEPVLNPDGSQAVDEEGKPRFKKAATILTSALLDTPEVKSRLAALNIDLSAAASVVATRAPRSEKTEGNGEEKPKKKKLKKAKEQTEGSSF